MRRAGGFALILLLLGVAFGLGLFLTRSGGLAGNSTKSVARPTQADPVAEVREQLAENYYRELGPKVLSRQTIPELLEALGDPNTEYLSAAEYTSLKNRTSRSYSGVGLTVEPSRAGLVVTSALRGPARQAGVRPGDTIVRIEGRPAGRLTFDQSVNLIKGETGTVVHLTVRRENGRRLNFTVVRSDVAVPSLTARLVRFAGTKIGYVRLQSFPASSAQRVNDATEVLVRRGAKGIILDLRDNPGGLLTEAVRTTSVFLDQGVVCTVAGLHQEETVYEVNGGAEFPRLPVTVLVNGGSASAAEIVAAALADNERAVVVGQRTYGKASVQSIRPLATGRALKLTTATYLTPSGADLAGHGIRPSVKVDNDPLTERDEMIRAAERVLAELFAA
ncbi:MAG TPA: S41 family peptidase [Gaiellaceae bacterium]|nr:S41 family peptidase [Gaiellaceae bacterium]